MTRIVCIAIGLAALSGAALADEKLATIEGAWRQVESKNGAAKEYEKLPDGVEMTDYIVGGRFIWTIVQNGKILGAAGGRYKLEKDKFTEIIEFVSGDGVPDSFVGSTFEFTVKLEGDVMTKVGTIQLGGRDSKIDEKWVRCKP
ncbi:hypothetical protein [Paludisphaera rhizosphaerae]|uniref:hypothetical protein n=1 Tax=Paludisphaera rhizosphaerae TaxID=2711216 RepID=UPI001F0F997B|nr:hypothetical protein [Paludisphaera rhizosphaerae]